MKVVHGTERWDRADGAPVATIGNFDGVHRGHRALIDATRARARAAGAPSVVLTFDPAPRDVLRPGNPIPRIQPLARKLVHLERAGVDAVVIQPFDRDLASLDADTFARRHLGEHLGVSALALGHDFRFGRGRLGDAQLLRDALGVPVDEIPALTDDHGPVSSSRIRAAIGAGDVALAGSLLGRPHEVVGPVVEGDRRGRTIGFPTANVATDGGGLCPAPGVYAVIADVAGGSQPGVVVGGPHPGVANLGVRPTFDGHGLRLEVHLLDFTGDLYGVTLTVAFVARIRDEQRFDGIDALVAQIHRDVAAARRCLGTT